MDVLAYSLDRLEIWFLMLFRIGGMLMVFPFYGYATVPPQARLALSVLLASLLLPIYEVTAQVTIGSGLLYFFAAIFREVLIGLSIGFAATFLFVGAMFAGQMVGHTMGFAIINSIDPQTDLQMPLIGQIYNLMVLVLFVLMNGHHFLLMALDESFIAIPIGTGILTNTSIAGIARLSADIFAVAVKIGAPVLIAILITEVALGVVARTVPQMNVWLIGFPLKIGVGLMTMGLSLTMMVYVVQKLYAGWQGEVIAFIRSMTG